MYTPPMFHFQHWSVINEQPFMLNGRCPAAMVLWVEDDTLKVNGQIYHLTGESAEAAGKLCCENTNRILGIETTEN